MARRITFGSALQLQLGSLIQLQVTITDNGSNISGQIYTFNANHFSCVQDEVNQNGDSFSYMVDPDYMATKIARWKEAGSTVDPLFITQRHVDMLPLPKLSEDGLKILLAAQQNVIESQLKSIQELSSQE